MANFPVLKTGVVAQYPSDRSSLYSTRVVRFLDGSEQRFPAYGTPLHRWLIRLDLLDEAELFNLEQFFEEVAGQATEFSFTDPWDGTVYPHCSLDSDVLATEYESEGHGKTSVVVKETRG